MQKILILGVLIFLFAGGAYYLGRQTNTKPSYKACTMEAKICPDGSGVGRVGPNCEFAECSKPLASPIVTQIPQPVSSPTPNPADETISWKTYTNTKVKFSIKYPVNLNFDVFEITDGVLIGPPRTDTVMSINYFYNSQKLNIADAVSNLFIKAEGKNDLDVEQGLKLLEDTPIGGQTSVRTEILTGSNLDKKGVRAAYYERQFVLTTDRQWLVSFEGSSLDDVENPAYRGLSNKMLSTIKFL